MPTKDKKFLTQIGPGVDPKVAERLSKPVPKSKKRVLTSQEWTFVHEFVSGDGHVTLKEAALRAGYPESWIRNTGAKALTDPDRSPHIVAEIQALRAELSRKYGTTYERHMRDLQLIRDQALAAGAYGAAVQAEYRRGQALGTIYIDRKEIRHGTIDSMSKEEVMRRLEEIRKLYGGSPVIDVTPEKVAESLAAEEAQEQPHVEEARDETVRETPRQPIKLPYYPD